MSNIIIKPYIEHGELIISIFDSNKFLGNFRVVRGDKKIRGSQWSFNGESLGTAFFQDALVKAMKIKGYVVEGSGDSVEFFARSSKDGQK